MIPIFPLFLLFTVIPALEIFLLINLSHNLGILNTFYIVIITGFLGAYFAKSQGREILSKIQNHMSSGQMPTDDIIEGLLVLVGGVLLITPGFITDFIGLSCVIPGPRTLIKVIVKKVFAKSVSIKTNFYHQTHSHSHSEGHETIKQVGPDTFEAEYKKNE